MPPRAGFRGKGRSGSRTGALVDCFERIAAEPGCGRRDGFRLGLRSVPCGELLVFYLELEGGTLGIVRVLHAGGNAAALEWAEGVMASDGY